MIFLYDGEKQYSYDDLLKAICEDSAYYPLFKSKDLFAYFSNLIKALAANQPLVLLDSDIGMSEIDGLDEGNINVSENINPVNYDTIQDVVGAVQNSSSEITIFTSGTTGQPKKVIHSISTLTRSVRSGEKYQGQIWAYAYNPTHMAGLQVFFQAFENLNTLVNVFGKSRNEVYKEILDKQITHISATPTFYRLLLPYEQKFNSVIRVTLGGEKSDQHLHDSIKLIFPNAKINNVYASTEAGSLFAAKGDCFQIPESICDKIKVEDDEIVIHKSLLGKSDSFRLSDDFYHSGDIIEWIDEVSGLFRFKSRKNELINIGGYKVNPGEVEDILHTIVGVQNAFVYGRTNSILGNVLCADIQLEKGAEISELDVKKHLASRLQDFKIPRRIKFVDVIELTRTGKLKRL